MRKLFISSLYLPKIILIEKLTLRLRSGVELLEDRFCSPKSYNKAGSILPNEGILMPNFRP